MRELFFVLKTFFVSVVLLAILQIRVGEDTLEMKSTMWVRRQGTLGFFQEMGKTLVKGYDKASHQLGKLTARLGSAEAGVGERYNKFQLKRSPQVEEQATDAYSSEDVQDPTADWPAD